MAIIPKPKFPNVPQLSGVPQLLRSAQFPAAPAPILGAAIALGRLFQALFSQPSWAIYKHQEKQPTVGEDGVETIKVVADRVPVVVPDSFLAFNYMGDYDLSDYPVQDGSFASYNKVSNPNEIMLRLSKGGSKEARRKFLASLDAIAGTLDLYDVLTPEKTYLAVNVTRVEIAREREAGAYFLTDVNVYLREIRVVTATYTNTAANTQNAQDPSAQPVENVGVVQGQSTTATPESVGIPEAQP